MGDRKINLSNNGLLNKCKNLNLQWWKAENIWATATKNKVKTAAILFGRCDIPFDGVVPEFCEHFIKITGHEIFRTNIDKALARLDEGYQFIGVS